MFLDPDLKLRVLVTGASGFVGGRVVEAMHLSGFGEPVAAIRQWSRAARVARFAGERFPGDIALCDILDPDQVHRAVAQVDAVVHCAYSDDRDAIVNGTRNLLIAAAEHNLSHFVYLSSAEVYGPTAAGEVTEQNATPKTGRLYGDAKAEAEAACREFAGLNLNTTILRPAIIYGPFGRSWTIDIAARLLSGKWGWFDELGDGIANLVYVDDLVQAIFLSLTANHTGSHTFNINGPDRISWNDYFAAFNTALGLPPLVRISANRSRWRTALMDHIGKTTDKIREHFEDQLMEIYLRGGWASQIMKRIKGNLDATPSTGELHDLYRRTAHYCDDQARELLQYEPRVDLNRGLQYSVDWLRHHELVPREASGAPPLHRETGELAAP